jgi:serine/threonine protein kinase
MNAWYVSKYSSRHEYHLRIFLVGILPPEMFHCFDGSRNNMVGRYLEYWEDRCKEGGELWDKIKPLKTKDGSESYCVVKTFDPQRYAVPYELVKASPQMDMWSLGVLLYMLLCNKPLFPVNRDDDIEDPAVMSDLLAWDDDRFKERCARLKQPNLTGEREGFVLGIDLVKNLLRRSSDDRPPSMQKVLEHQFLSHKGSSNDDKVLEYLEKIESDTQMIKERTEAIDKRTKRIESIAEKTVQQIMKTERVLLKGEIARLEEGRCRRKCMCETKVEKR